MRTKRQQSSETRTASSAVPIATVYQQRSSHLDEMRMTKYEPSSCPILSAFVNRHSLTENPSLASFFFFLWQSVSF